MKLRVLKPQIQVASTSRVQTLQNVRGSVERKRGSAGVKDRIKIRQRDCGMCQECNRQGRVTLGTVVDHIQPLWNGGSDEDDNKELLCDGCHESKTAREATERSGR